MKRMCLLICALAMLLCACSQSGQPSGPVQTPPAENTQATETTAPPNEASEPVTGWQTDDRGRFYLHDDGSRATGWLEAGSNLYFLDENGYATTGWYSDGEKQYYFLEDGAMARGQVQIDGVNHFFTSAGQPILVVNPWNAVPEGFSPELVELSTAVAVSGSYVDSSCKDAMTQMILDCNAQSGSSVCVVSAYRSYQLQESNFNRKVDSYISAGYSREDAYAAAATIIAVPGTSEHHLGLAADIIDTQIWDLVEEQEELPGQQWLMENCWRYGFILRYPKDKIDETGIIYEPWHYRYVGLQVAEELHLSGMTLEAYMESIG